MTEPKTRAARLTADEPVVAEPYSEKDIGRPRETIVIVRREVVATIREADDGERPMLMAAFDTIGEYVVENSQTNVGMHLEFEYGGATFYAGIEAESAS